MKWVPSHKFLNIFISLFVFGIIAILIYLSIGELSTTETGLLSTILTILSVIAAWVVSHLYAASSHDQAIEEVKNAHQENLQTYALKAAEKVNNLSDQLNKLAIYLKEEIESSEYDTVEETLRAREERLQSTIHMIAMLKSINDTALSDWQGVIGEQLEEQREERQEREVELKEIADRLENLWHTRNLNAVHDNNLAQQLNNIKGDVNHLMAEIAGSSLSIKRPPRKSRREINCECPNCHNSMTYTQKARTNSNKLVSCSSCDSSYISKYSKSDDEFILEPREEINEVCECPSCQETVSFTLDNFPSGSKQATCENCSSQFRVVRLLNGSPKITSKTKPNNKIEQEFIDQVKLLLPKQPWPKDTHKDVAEKIGCSPSKVSRATKMLINQGDYKQQIDGKLYDLVEISNE